MERFNSIDWSALYLYLNGLGVIGGLFGAVMSLVAALSGRFSFCRFAKYAVYGFFVGWTAYAVCDWLGANDLATAVICSWAGLLAFEIKAEIKEFVSNISDLLTKSIENKTK